MSTSAVCARRGALRSSGCSAPSTRHGSSGELIRLSVLGRIALVLGALLAVAAGTSSCTAGHADPDLPAVFTADQARQGRRVYKTACARCHCSELEGPAAPALAGPAFLRNGWPAGPRRFDGSVTMLSQIRLDAVAAPAALAPTEFIAGKDGPPLDPTGPSLSELVGAASANWPYHTGNYSGTRYSQLTELTPANAARLRVACVFQVGTAEVFQTGPVVYKGVMYVTAVRQTVALDAATCRPRWRYTWQPRDYELWPMNRW